ncbi:putative deacylase [Neohortaea acidophila]|uniref:Putative deacylase n=1 Tax=Neohortaea acidophila TaxID=245834 RepID=A0A6A6PMU7_9PEZI|nr:putative deacylase [Neohortaea acidophila]KAF2481235.1 putative deacylase [Neohortaea acidophila]
MTTPKFPAFRTGKRRHEQGTFTPVPNGAQIPYAILEASEPGPVLLITAGVHGSEVSSIEAALRLMRLAPCHILKGTLIILPILNISGFRARSIYIMPEDGKNLNRQFPGTADGSASQRLAFWLAEEMLPACDAYLDLHGGDLDEDLRPFVISNKGHEPSRELALASGFDTVVDGFGARPVASACAAGMGIPALTIEAGHNGVWSEESVSLHYNAVMRIMAYLRIAKEPSIAEPSIAEPSKPSPPRTVELFVPVASVSGFWYPRQAVGALVTPGAVLGEIKDAFGVMLSTIRSEVSGDVLYQLTSLCVNEGEQLLGVAHSAQ